MDITNLQKVYDEIAMNVFNSYGLIRDGEVFELAEIEIYLIDPTMDINDLFIHADAQQKKFEEIYHHFSGIDICLGNEKLDKYCGVLIRGIFNEQSIIYGPGRIAYSYTGEKDKKCSISFKNKNTDLVFSDESTANTKLSNIIFQLPRVNLSAGDIKKNLKVDLNETYKYLNLKARYLRIIDENFSTPKKNAPAEHREVFNAYITHLKKLNY